MKKYRYINCENLDEYDDWDIVQIIPGKDVDMVVIMKEDKSIQDSIKLNEVTTNQLLEELYKRVENK